MKTLRFLILGLLATATVCRAQITQPGFYQATNFAMTPVSAGGGTARPQGQGFSPMYSQSTPIAEIITPDIQALADGLQDDPVKIFNYVHDHIRFVLYFGSKKGAELTLLEKSGNDFDQCALLVALLRAAGYSPGYSFGLMEMPYNATDSSANDLQHWLQLTVVNTNWTNTVNYFSYLLGKRGYPTFITGYDQNTIGLQRVWVTLTVNGTNYMLDPAFKVSQPLTGFSLASIMGVSSNGLMSAAGGTDTNSYVTNLNEAALNGTLTGYTTNFLNWLQTNDPNASVQNILGGWQVVPSTNTALSQSLLFQQDTQTLPVQTWNDEPTNLMSSLTINFARTNYQWWMPQLQGSRLTLLYTTNGLAQLWQDDNELATNQTTASDTNVILSAAHPYGTWDFNNNVLIPGVNDNQTTTNVYQRTNATYCLMYAFEPDWSWLQKRQNQLDTYRQTGLADTSRQVTSETLEIMGLGWMLQTAYADRLSYGQLNVLPEYVHRIGRMSQEGGKGYYVDVYMQESGGFANSGTDTNSVNNQNTAFDLSSYFWSALEHGIIEGLQSSNLLAASTVKMLEIANTNHQAVFLANSDNWSTVQGSLKGYDLTYLGNFISQGYYLLLPQSGTNSVAGGGTWKGYGIAARLQNGSYENMAMLIGGGYNGGYVDLSGATVNPPYVNQSSDSQPLSFTTASPFTFNPSAADPVDMANGTFQVEHTDLTLGGPEPHGITLSRYYNGARRFSNPSGMAGGWINNYTVNAVSTPAPQAGLGGTTPAQAAPMLAATAAALAIYNGSQPDPKNWTVTALIAKWGIDQLTKGGVSVNMGRDTVQFVKQPNGVYTPPANCTMTLIQTNSIYWLQQRHGNTFKFDSLRRLTNIVDQYSQSLNVSYLNSTSSLPYQVTDWKSRVLTFSYTNGQLASVSDNSTPSRKIYYNYSAAYNSQGDLTSFTDAEGKTSTYVYDGNHDLTATLDALNRLVVSNNVDSLGHVTTQLTDGDPNQTWQIFWSGWRTIVQDPAGGQQNYFYDDQTRLIGTADALGNLTQTFYDGQSHVVTTISPLNETNQFFYDGSNNLVAAIDPLGYTNQFFYDGQNRLYLSLDPRGNPTTYGYNAQFSLTGLTNGAGDWVNYSYNTDGTIHTRTDLGGVTTYGYDTTYGQLNAIICPGLSTNGFLNNAFGDVLSQTNGRGFVTSFQYNNRRQLTNSIAPTNMTTRVAYDAIGNAVSATDARGFSTTNTWGVTRHLLATTLPATPAGTAIVTNLYDNRDWPVKTIDPLQHATLYTNDAAQHLTSVTDPLTRTTTLTYDSDGHNITSTNAARNGTTQQYDARGSLTVLTDPAGRVVQRAYDGAGNQITLTNRNGKKWQFQFDAANRLTNTVSPLGRSSSEAYNNRGLLTLSTSPSGHTNALYYDAKGRLTNHTDNVATTLFKYDADDNPTNVVENSLTNAWTYDAYDRVASYKDVFGNLIQYKYDLNGNVTNLIYPGNKNVYYAYDNLNHMTNVTDWSGRKTGIAYDLAGRLTGITRPNGTQRTITYDAAGQTTKIAENLTNGASIALFKFGWDNAARMQFEYGAPLPATSTPPTRTMTFDDDNRLTKVDANTVMNDSDGNMTNGPLTSDTLVTYTYDARNRLLNAGGVTNAYDAMNNRVGQMQGTNATVFVVNPNAKLPQVLMRIKNGVTNYYIYGAGLLYQITEAATGTNTLTYHYDYRGSTVALTDGTGTNVTDRIGYSAYATTTFRTGTNDTPFLFNGRYGVQTDPNGLLYMRARYYNPFICRFLNPDPSGFGGGLNFYAYADGNPVSYLDPFGLGALGENVNTSWLVSENSVPNVTYTIQPNVNTGPQMGPLGFTPAPPYFDPRLQFSYSTSYANDVTFQQVLQAVVQVGGTGLQVATMVGIGLLTDFVGDLGIAAESDMVTVTHYTDEAGMNAISQSGTVGAPGLQPPFVTLPSEIPAGSTAEQAEQILEIQPGRGQYSITFQTPAENLMTPFNGPTTSGNAIQFQLINPAPINPANFIKTP